MASQNDLALLSRSTGAASLWLDQEALRLDSVPELASVAKALDQQGVLGAALFQSDFSADGVLEYLDPAVAEALTIPISEPFDTIGLGWGVADGKGALTIVYGFDDGSAATAVAPTIENMFLTSESLTSSRPLSELLLLDNVEVQNELVVVSLRVAPDSNPRITLSMVFSRDLPFLFQLEGSCSSLKHLRSALSALTVLAILVGACTSSGDEPGGVAQATVETIAPDITGSTTTEPVVGSSDAQTTTSEMDSTTRVEASSETDPFTVNRGLARTLNIGAVFEVAKGETWAIDFAPEDLDDIAAQGFTAVRVPIKWSDWADPLPTFSIAPVIYEQIDAVVERALDNDLSVIIDVHHYEELDADPEAEAERFLAIWFQIAEHYQNMPQSVVFEVSNEPHDQFSGDVLNALLEHVVPIIRQSNPDRTIMIGPDQWYSPLRLDELELPDDDNLIVTVHQYEPFPFTHQGASWVEGSDAWVGTGFDDPGDRELLEGEFVVVAEWAARNNVPIFIGEFGALDGAERQDRLDWTRFVREQSELHDFSWAYWDWATPGFGLYNHANGKWDVGLLEALLDT